MDRQELGNNAAKGAVWATADRFLHMGLQFVVNLVLANLLVPADYGAIVMLAIFISVSQILIDGGFSSALIQKKEPTQTDYSTVFYWNTAFSCALYLILFALAPLIARFYHMPELCAVLRAIGLSIIISSTLTIQHARLRKQLAFRTLAITNISTYIVSSAVGIVMASNGAGVWSLVTMQLLYGLFSVIILLIITRWLPSAVFSTATMKELFSFGGFILAANVLQTICQNLQGLIIGRRFNATETGYYGQAYKLDQVTSYSLPQVIVQVMYPVYSSIQDDRERLAEMLLMNIRVICFTIFPTLAGLILCADELFLLLYKDLWLPAAPYFRVLCVSGLFMCLQNVNFYAVAAVGRSRALFNWSIYKWGFLLAALLAGMFFGIYGILWAMVLSSFNIFMVNAYLAQRYVGISMLREMRVIAPMLLMTFASFAPALLLKEACGLHAALCLALMAGIYLLLVKTFMPVAIQQFTNLVRRLTSRKQK